MTFRPARSVPPAGLYNTVNTYEMVYGRFIKRAVETSFWFDFPQYPCCTAKLLARKCSPAPIKCYLFFLQI